MRILLLNQTFYPDVVATAQYSTDLAVALAARGHQVTALAGRRAYDQPERLYEPSEEWQNVRIERVPSLNLGKSSKLRRALVFASFLLSVCWRLLWAPRYDTVIALTSPPLIGFLAALFVKVRGGRLICWIMDLNPDEAIAAGWLSEKAWITRLFQWMLRYSLAASSSIVVLDRFMRDSIAAKGVPASKIATIPPWPQDHSIRFDPHGAAAFRAEHGLGDKFVVMYAGNHSPCHPMDTILDAARALAKRDDVAFCFLGGGSEWPRIRAAAARESLAGIHCIPYQPFATLPAALSAADLHIVVMGDPFVGIIHPCKIYNALAIGASILYVGPSPSHVTDLADRLAYAAIDRVGHGDTAGAVGSILNHVANPRPRMENAVAQSQLTQERLVRELVLVIEGVRGRTAAVGRSEVVSS